MTLKISTLSGDLITGTLDRTLDFSCRKTAKGYATKIKRWRHVTADTHDGTAGIRHAAYAAIAIYRNAAKPAP